MANKKAFVRYANNKLVPASVFIGAKAPAVGVWKEIPYDLCCDAPICPQPDYSPWRLVTGGVAGDGVVLIDNPDKVIGCPEFTFVGPNDDDGNGWVYLKQYFSSTTCLEIQYEWTSFDDGDPNDPPSVDLPVYWTSLTEPTGIPGDLTPQVGGTPADGTWNITVAGGQWFAIGIYSTDSCCGRGFLQVEICEQPCPTTTSTTTNSPTTTTSTTTNAPTSCCTPTIAWNSGASGDGGSQLDFTYVGGPSCTTCTNLKLQYSTDNVNWTNYSPLFACNATGVFFNYVSAGISFGETYYVRLITVCGGVESIPSVSVPVTAI